MEFQDRVQESGFILGFVFIGLCLFPIQVVFAQYHFELTPRLSVSEVYDDNIDLDSTDEKSDFITTVSPGITFDALSENQDILVRYAPTFAWYGKYDDNDTVRHSGTLQVDRDLTQHLAFNMTDTYIKSEEPIEETVGVEGVRRTRNTYQRNTGSAALRYIFGTENACVFGYDHSWLENNDITLDDGTIQNPFGSVTYWFNIKDGMELDYEFTQAIFWRDEAPAERDDYKGYGAGIRYIRRFTPHSTGSLRGHFTDRRFERTIEDYQVYDGSVDFEHAFSPHLSAAAGGGYFLQKREVSDDVTGYSYHVSLIKAVERGSFNFQGRGGWDEAYLDAEQRGFIRFWELSANVNYQLLERLSGYVDGSYRRDKDEVSREWETWSGRCGMSWVFGRWYSLALDYTHLERDDDVDFEDYRVNRVMLILSASGPYRW
jgi:hypothetical protein